MNFYQLSRIWILGLVVTSILARANQQKSPDAEREQKVLRMAEEVKTRFQVPTVMPRDVVKLLDAKSHLLVDVREKDEFNVSRIPGAIHKDEFEKNKASYKSYKIFAYCTIGHRSALFTRDLLADGFDVKNLHGSLLLWTHRKFPVVDKRNQRTNRIHVYGKRWDLLPHNYQSVYSGK